MPESTRLNLVVMSPSKLLFEGTASSVVLPGQQGVFEVQPYHKNIFSRLFHGRVIIDGKSLSVKRGIARVRANEVTLIVEE